MARCPTDFSSTNATVARRTFGNSKVIPCTGWAVAPRRLHASRRRRYNRPVSSPPRILIVKLSSFGDILHALSLVDVLRSGFPEATIDWVVRADLAHLVAGHPALNSIHSLPRKAWRDGIAMGRRLRDQHYDIVFDIQGLFYSGWLTWLTRAPRRIGFNTNREGNRCFLTDASTIGDDRAPMAVKILRTAERVGLFDNKVVAQTWLVDAGRDTMQQLLPRSLFKETAVGLVVGASTPVKTLSPERWASLALALRGAGCEPVLIGGKQERPLAESIVAEVPCIDMVGKTPLSVLPAIIAECGVVVGGDTGATHLAAALGVPVVGLYGATDPARSGADWGPGPSVILDGGDADSVRNFRHAPEGIIDRIPEERILDSVMAMRSVGDAARSPRGEPVE